MAVPKEQILLEVLFDYLEYPNTEVWILTATTALPTAKIITAGIHWFIFKRSSNWDTIQKKYTQFSSEQKRKVVSPLDAL